MRSILAATLAFKKPARLAWPPRYLLSRGAACLAFFLAVAVCVAAAAAVASHDVPLILGGL